MPCCKMLVHILQMFQQKKQPQQDMVQEEGFALRHKYTIFKKSVPYTIFLPNNHLRKADSIYSTATKIYAGV